MYIYIYIYLLIVYQQLQHPIYASSYHKVHAKNFAHGLRLGLNFSGQVTAEYLAHCYLGYFGGPATIFPQYNCVSASESTLLNMSIYGTCGSNIIQIDKTIKHKENSTTSAHTPYNLR